MDVRRGPAKTRLADIHDGRAPALMLELIAAPSPYRGVVAFDDPSQGHSDRVTEQPRTGDDADCGVAVMAALALRRFHERREAVGSAVATDIAGRYPDRVGKTDLVSCPFVPGARSKDSPAPIPRHTRPGDASGFPATRRREVPLGNDPGHAPMNPSQSWMDRVSPARIEAGRERRQASDAPKRDDRRTGPRGGPAATGRRGWRPSRGPAPTGLTPCRRRTAARHEAARAAQPPSRIVAGPRAPSRGQLPKTSSARPESRMW